MSKVIVLEGIDKTGKTTILKTLHGLTNYQFVIIDRFTGSNIVYGVFHKREIDIPKLLTLEQELVKSKTVIPVYLVANKKEISKRIRKHQEKDIEIKDIDGLMLLYKKYMLKSPFNYFILDTSYKTAEECAMMIYNEMLKRELDDKL